MKERVHIFRQVLSPSIVNALLDDLESLAKDDHPKVALSKHQSRVVGCCCRRCTPEVLRSCRDSGEPCAESIEKALLVLHGLLGVIPETHCINRLTCGARHLHHVDGNESWWKFIIVLSSALSGGMLSIARRCEPCVCLADGRCEPLHPIEVDLQPGDAYGIWSGRVCHGISPVRAGVRVTWALRYAREPEAIPELMKPGLCAQLAIGRTLPKFERA